MESGADYMRRVVPYWRTLGLEIVEMAQGRALFEMEFRPEHLQNGVMHGGAIASLLDSALACAVVSRLFPDAYATTSHFEISYVKPVTAGLLRAEATCLKVGRTLCFSEGKVRSGDGELVAAGSSQLVRIPLPVPPLP